MGRLKLSFTSEELIKLNVQVVSEPWVERTQLAKLNLEDDHVPGEKELSVRHWRNQTQAEDNAEVSRDGDVQTRRHDKH